MTTIVTRTGKGSLLSWIEADANFTNLNTDKLEVSSNLSDVDNATTARTNLGLGNVDNTSDLNKPVSTATQTAIDASITTHVALADPHTQYLRESVAAASGGSALIGYTSGVTGAVTKTVENKLRETISVKDFGAVADGVADDTAAIQAALNSANALPYQVLEVLIPRGIYKITGTITQPANVTVTGPGTIQPTAPFTGSVVWDYNNTAGYQDTTADSRGGIDRLRIKASGTVTATALKLTMGWSNVIRNVLLTGVTGTGVHLVSGLWNLENVKVQHAFTYGTNNSTGFFLDWCADSSLTNVEAVGYHVGLDASANAGNNHVIRAHCWGYWYDNTTLNPTGPLCRFPFIVTGDNNVLLRCIADTPETGSASMPWSQLDGGIGFSLLGNSSSLIGCIVSSNPVYLATPKLCGVYVYGEQNNIVACHALYGMKDSMDGLVFATQAKKLTNFVSGGNIGLHNTAAVATVPFSYNNGTEITTSVFMTVTAQKLSSTSLQLTLNMTLADDPTGLLAFQAILTGPYFPYSTTKVRFPVPEWGAFSKNAAAKAIVSIVGEIHLGVCRFYTVNATGSVSDTIMLNDFKAGTVSASVNLPITF